jgi:hypothetical protein
MRMRSTLVLATALGTLSFAAHAQSAAQVSTFKGTNLGTFISFGPTAQCADGSIGDVSGFGFVSAGDSISRRPGEPPDTSNGVSVDVFGYSNSCTGDFIGFGVGGLAGGYTPPNPALRSAAVSGTLFVQDLDTGASYPMNLNLVFTGDGSLTNGPGAAVTHNLYGYTVTVSRGVSKSRDAIVTGSIDINGNEVDASFFSTTLASNSTGSVAVQKN